MRYALVDGRKTEATKGVKGICPGCGSELIAKFYKEKIDHWAHKGNRNCDPWWENETEWHRTWKDNFPIDWQEVVHKAEDDEKHIADVKTKEGWVLEFQHSYIKPEERHARNTFYRKIVWVVDGLRRPTDVKQFQNMLDESSLVSNKPHIRQVMFPEECRLLKEWHSSNAFVFFDFQKVKASKQIMLWFLFPKRPNSETYIGHFSRTELIELHNNNKFGEIVRNSILPIHNQLIENEQIIRARNERQFALQLQKNRSLNYPKRRRSYGYKTYSTRTRYNKPWRRSKKR